MNWLKAIADATSLERLLDLVNQYLLAVPEEHWAWVPRDARPGLVATVAELHDWHRRLSDAVATASSPNIRMQDLAVFFLRASARAIEIERDRPSSNDGSRSGNSFGTG